MDAEAGVALTETDKEKTIADDPPVATDAITIGLAQERPERAFLENPIAWWGDTPWLLWNKEYGGILGLWRARARPRRSASSSSTTSRRSSP